MAKLFLTLTVLCVFGAVMVEGLDSRIMQIFMPHVSTCKEEVGASFVDVLELTGDCTNYSMKAKCLFACIMKKTNLMDDNGKFVKAAALTYLKNNANGNEAVLKIGEDIINSCAAISVDSNPCEAAAQYGICFKKELKDRDINL